MDAMAVCFERAMSALVCWVGFWLELWEVVVELEVGKLVVDGESWGRCLVLDRMGRECDT